MSDTALTETAPAAHSAQPNPYRQITQGSWKKARPIQALFEITYRCNHLCTFCNNPLSREGSELTTEEAFRVLRELKELGILFITLTGGEPLLRKDFWQIAEEARRLKLAIRVFTNAYLIDDATADRLKALSIVETSISIHGSKPEVHEKLTRIPGSFQRVLDAVERLRKRDMRVILKTPVTRLNEHDLFDIKAIADRAGAFMIFDTTITPRFDGDVSPLGLAPSEEFYEWFWSDVGAPLRNNHQPRPKDLSKKDELEGCCGTGRSGLMVDPYGNVYPCALWFRKLGNVREQTVSDIWDTSAQLHEVRRIASEVQKEVIPTLEDGAFMTWCPATAEAMTGDAKQAYRPVLLNAKYMRKAFEARAPLVQIEGMGGADQDACAHD